MQTDSTHGVRSPAQDQMLGNLKKSIVALAKVACQFQGREKNYHSLSPAR